MTTEKINKEYRENRDNNEDIRNDENITQDNTAAEETTAEETKSNKSQQETGSAQAEKEPEETNLKARAEEYLQLLQRVQADFDNYRRRTVQEREESAKYCSMRLATGLLPVLDNFERALKAEGEDLQSFRNGIELIYRQLCDVLEKEGVRPMEAVGSQFDPNLHEAVMQEQSDQYDDNVVIEEFQKGYLLADRVIRPAMVKVAKN